MVEYLYSCDYYDKLLLTDTNTSTDYIPKYISKLNNPEFSRYLVSKNRKYTTKESYLYKILEGEDIGINNAARNGHLEIVKYLYSQGVKASEWVVNWAAMNGRVTSKTT
jgi:hypothetical protein